MKRLLVILLIGVGVGIALGWAFFHATLPPSVAETPSSEGEPGSVEAGALHLDREAQVRAGLVIESLHLTNVAVGVRGYARVLDSALLARPWQEWTVARVNADASRAEWTRLKTLFDHGQNASARALEAGTALRERDEALERAAREQFLASWGKALGQRPDLEALVDRLSSLEAALVRVEIPAGAAASEAPRRIVMWVGLEGTGTTSAPVDWFAPAPSTDPTTQATAYLGVVEAAGLTPGMVREAWVELGEGRRRGVFLPASAVVRQGNTAWVFRTQGDEDFVRTPVRLDHALEGGWLVAEGLADGQGVVVWGAQVLLSQEWSAGGGEE